MVKPKSNQRYNVYCQITLDTQVRCLFGEHLQDSQNASSGRQGQANFPAAQVTFILGKNSRN